MLESRLQNGLLFRMLPAGKTLIHPSTITECNKAFTPSKADIHYSQRVIHAMKEARDLGLGVATLDGCLLEELHAVKAERVLAMVRD